MTGNDHLDDLAREVMDDVLVGIVTDKLSVPQAVQAIDDFADSLKGKVSDEARMETKANLLEYVFDLREIREKQQREETDDELQRAAELQELQLRELRRVGRLFDEAVQQGRKVYPPTNTKQDRDKKRREEQTNQFLDLIINTMMGEQ